MAGVLFRVNGRSLYVEQHGPRDAHPVVLLHHGLGSTRSWSAQIPALAEAGYRVIAYDRWGYGRSDSRPALDAPVFHEDISDLRLLLEQLEAPCPAIIGHSDGGTIALYIAAQYPSEVSCLVTVAAHIYVEDRMSPGIEEVRKSYTSDPRFQDGLRRLHGDKVDSVFYNWYGAWVRPESLAWDMRPLLAQIACPSLVVQGVEDEHATPKHASDIAAGIPGARLWLVSGARHMFPQESPQLINPPLLDFLSRVLAQERSHVQ